MRKEGRNILVLCASSVACFGVRFSWASTMGKKAIGPCRLKEGGKEGRTEGGMEGRKPGRKVKARVKGRMDGWKEEGKKGRKKERKDGW